MSPQQVIATIKHGQSDNGWIIYRYDKVYAALSFFSRLFLTVVCLGYVVPTWYQTPKPIEYELKVTLLSLGALGVLALLFFVMQLYTLLFLRSTMIVLTDTHLIKSLRGRVHYWEYKDIQNLRQIVQQSKKTSPRYSIEFKDRLSGKIVELTNRNQFGHPEKIFVALKKKVPCAQTNSFFI